jgi:hypothetical protein
MNMIGQVWVELRYGVSGQGIALCKTDNPYLLKVFKRCALERASQLAVESDGIDAVIHIQDEAELERLEKLLAMLIPGSESLEGELG